MEEKEKEHVGKVAQLDIMISTRHARFERIAGSGGERNVCGTK